jgi:hypothetical protein
MVRLNARHELSDAIEDPDDAAPTMLDGAAIIFDLDEPSRPATLPGSCRNVPTW